jgi:hypothetical protein
LAVGGVWWALECMASGRRSPHEWVTANGDNHGWRRRKNETSAESRVVYERTCTAAMRERGVFCKTV